MSTILIADDDDDIRSTLTLLLEDEGYTVLEASTAQSMLHLLSTHPNKLIVLLDLSLRVGNERVIDTIARDPDVVNRHTCILFTAASQTDIAQFGKGLPVISKPFDVSTLLDTIKHFCTE